MAEKNDEHMDALNTMEKVIRRYLGIVRAPMTNWTRRDN